jgi:hypothetical protein
LLQPLDDFFWSARMSRLEANFSGDGESSALPNNAGLHRSGTLHTIFHIPSCWGAAIPRDHRMEIKVNFLDKLRLEAKFDDFTLLADQPL